MKSELYKKYKSEIVPKMQEEFGIENIMTVPKLEKVSVNVGINSKSVDSNFLSMVEKTLVRITGQKPVRTKAKKAISAFKIRDGMIVGMKVTLRGDKMYHFVNKLVNISIPRIRDFRGLDPKSVNNRGNLTLGFKEHIVFPEIGSDEVERVHGLEITVATSATNYDEGLKLLRLMGFPFTEEVKKKKKSTK